ncbi:MAG: TolC family protein [Planctomycetes bacterium]|nr:TolC family protein [Planctomycetota bacterium]
MNLDRHLARWRSERGYLDELMKYLAGIHPVQEDAYPLVYSLARSIELEEFKSAQELGEELEAIASAIKPILTVISQIRDFHQKLQAYRTEAISRAGFASFLSDLLKGLQETKRIELPEISQKLEELTRHHNLLSRTRGLEFFGQWEAYIKEIKDTVFEAVEERRIDNLDKQIFFLGKLKRLELARLEWDDLNDWMQQAIVFDGVTSGLAKRILWLFAEETTLVFRHFYETTFKRDQVFLENIKKLSAKQADKTVVVITGGFHRQTLADSFREEGISFVVVTPDIDEIPEKTRYHDYMRGQVSWNKYFEVRNGRIDLRAAFTEATVDRLMAGSQKQGLVLKEWRDSVIRNLYEQGRIALAGRYTRLLDKKIKNALNDDMITRFTEKWSANLERFIERIKGLDRQERLTEIAVARILASPTNQFAEAVPAGSILAALRLQSLTPRFLLRYPAFRARSELRTDVAEVVNLNTVIRQPPKWFKPYDLDSFPGNKANRHFLKNAFRVADALDIKNVDIVNGFVELDEEITASTVSFWRTDPAATITFANAATLALVLLESEFAYEPAAAVSRILGTRVASNKGLSLRQLAPIFTGVKNIIDELTEELARSLSSINFDRDAITPESAERFKQHVYRNIYRLTPALEVTHYEINNALSRWKNRQVSFQETTKNVRDAEDTLKNLLNDPELRLSDHLELIPTETPTITPFIVDQFAEVRTAVDERTEIREFKLAIEQTRIATAVAKNQALPQLDLNFTYDVAGIGESGDSSFDNMTTNRFRSSNVSLTFSVPLGNRAPRAAHQRARFQESQAIVRLNQVTDGVVKEVNDAVRAIFTRFEQIPTSFDASEASENNLRAMQARALTITPSFLETELNSVERLANDRTRLLQVIVDYNVQIVALERAKGTLLEYNHVVVDHENRRR